MMDLNCKVRYKSENQSVSDFLTEPDLKIYELDFSMGLINFAKPIIYKFLIENK